MPAVIGSKARMETVVTEQDTAMHIGSGLLRVFATPRMAAMMEQAAVWAVQDDLKPEEGTVGVSLELSHDSATPEGMRVWVEAELTEIEGRMLTFAVSAWDEAGPIGSGTHRRVIIQNAPFMQKAQKKLKRSHVL